MQEIYLLNVSFLDEDSLFEPYYQNLSPYRKEKTDRYRWRKDKNLSVGAGILLNYCLETFGRREHDMEYIFGKNKKPFFKDFDKFFSISHSETMVALSFSDSETGCDIQFCQHLSYDTLSKRFFTPNEYDSILHSAQPEKMFYRIWTIKESYLKFTGQGIGNGLNFFDVRFEKTYPEIFHNGKKENVFINEYCCDDYFLSVCGSIKDKCTIQRLYPSSEKNRSFSCEKWLYI